MWLIVGPFGVDESSLANVRTTKLLRTGRDYTFGRKDADLVIGSKRISAKHGVFRVGEFDPENPTAVPTLTFETFKKNFDIERGDSKEDCEPVTVHELRDNDKLVVLTVQLRIEWRRICCYSTELNDLLPQCKSLGINLVRQPSPEVTHHLTQTLSPTALLAASLISSAQFVKPEWLKDVVALGDDAHRQLALARYTAEIDANLDLKAWEPNEERLHIFKSYRFLYLVEHDREVPLDIRRMIERGDGSLEKNDIHLGVNRFLQGIQRGSKKEGKKLVLVGDPALLEAALDKDVLEEFKDVAKSYGLSFHSPDELIQAVLDVDTSKLDAETTALPPAPKETPPVVEAPRRPMRRKVPSREPSAPPPEPAPAPVPQAPLPTIMRLKRRRNPVEDMVTGLDDPSSILDAPPDLSAFSVPRAPTTAILQAPTPGKPMRRRNRQTSVEPNTLGSVQETVEVPDSFKEPPLKRFKALFEASDPSRLGSMTSGANFDSQINDNGFSGGSLVTNGYSLGMMSQTQMESQSGIASGSKGKSVQSLSALREEEEEETGPSTFELGTTAASKRKRAGDTVDGDGDALMDDVESHPPPKRRATGDAQAPTLENGAANGQVGATVKAAAAVEPSSKTKSKTKAKGAATGKPDEDSAFLRAVASTKRGKKNEDEFDREFNNLRIAKPKLNDPPDEPEKWAVLAEFGDDSGLRGNFMTIVEMEIFKEQNPNERRASTASGSGLKPEWEGKPNFKKFKKKVTKSERPKIDLVAVNEFESSLPASYWKDSTQSRSQPKPAARRAASAARSPPPPSDDDAEEEIPVPPPNKRKQSQASTRSASRSRAGSRAGSAEPVPTRRAATRRVQTVSVIEEDDEDGQVVQVSQRSRRSQSVSQKSSALFLPDDDEDEDDDGSFAMDDDDDNETMTLQSKEDEESFPKRVATRKAPVRKPSKPVREDSDDEGVFTGF